MTKTPPARPDGGDPPGPATPEAESTPAQAAADDMVPSRADQIAALEFEKLEREVEVLRLQKSAPPKNPKREAEELRKLTAEADSLESAPGREKFRTISAVVTAVVGVAAVVGTIYFQTRALKDTQTAQIRQFTESAATRRAESFARQLAQFGNEESLTARLAAATSLGTFLTERAEREDATEANYALQVVTLFVAAARVERGVLGDLTSTLLVQNSSEYLLQALVGRNHELQAALKAAVPAMGDEELRRGQLPLEPDSVVSAMIEELVWNVNTLVGTVTGLSTHGDTLRDADLSNTMLSVAERRAARFAPTRRTRNIGDSTRFVGVNLTGAVLTSLEFEDCIFDAVILDRAQVAGARFENCRFTGANQLQDLSPVHADMSDDYRVYPTRWRGGVLTADTFSFLTANLETEGDLLFIFEGLEEWSFQSLPSLVLVSCVGPLDLIGGGDHTARRRSGGDVVC